MKQREKWKIANHLFEESVAIFGEFDVTSATNEPEPENRKWENKNE